MTLRNRKLLAVVCLTTMLGGCSRLLRPDLAAPAAPPDPRPVSRDANKTEIKPPEEMPLIAAKEPPQAPEPGPRLAPPDEAPSFTSSDAADDASPPEPIRLPSPVDLPVPPPPDAPQVATPRDEPLIEAMRAILTNRHEEAIKHLKSYNDQNEEIFLRLLPVLALMTKKSVEQLSPEEATALSGQLEQLMQTLRTQSDLAIRKMCYCEWVKSFGAYKALPADYGFLAPSRNCPGELVQVYTEISNLSTQLNDGYYTTQLSGFVEIHDRKGEKVYHRRFTCEQPVQTLTPLRDYYNTCSFYVPSNMPPGTYTLTIHVTDETLPQRRRTASRSMEFRVSGLPRLPQ